MSTAPIIDLTDESFQNPHSLYQQLRAQGSAAHQVRLPNGVLAWIVIDYDAVRQVLGDPSTRKHLHAPAGRAALLDNNAGYLLGNPFFQGNMLFSDPPQHTRLRKLVAPAFTMRAIGSLEPRITEIADELLTDMGASGQAELLASFAFPLPIIVICELLGIPQQDRDAFRRWSAAMLNDSLPTQDRITAGIQFQGYMAELVDHRRATPGTDLVSNLIAGFDGDRLSEQELMSTITLLLVAGHETTVNLIGNAVAAMVADSRIHAQLSAEPDGIPDYLEEIQRHNGPVHLATVRYTDSPITVGDQTIDTGQVVIASIGGANRDPKRFDRPDSVDPARTDNRHLAFGHGMHFCLGAPLARMEASIALTRLLARFPNLSLSIPAGQLRWRPSLVVRGLTELPVHLQHAAVAS